MTDVVIDIWWIIMWLNIASGTCIKSSWLLITIGISISLWGITHKDGVCEPIVLLAELQQSIIWHKKRRVVSVLESKPGPYRFIFKNLFLLGTSLLSPHLPRLLQYDCPRFCPLETVYNLSPITVSNLPDFISPILSLHGRLYSRVFRH